MSKYPISEADYLEIEQGRPIQLPLPGVGWLRCTMLGKSVSLTVIHDDGILKTPHEAREGDEAVPPPAL